MLFMICAREEDERNVDTGKANVCLVLFNCYNFKLTRTASKNSNNLRFDRPVERTSDAVIYVTP